MKVQLKYIILLFWQKIIGKDFSEEKIKMFLDLKNKHLKPETIYKLAKQKNILDNLYE